MDLSHPFRVVGPTLDGDVLAVLARGSIALTGREIARRSGASQDGVRIALDRLVRQGIVRREQAGRAHQFVLNRDHLAAEAIQQLADVRTKLIHHLRALVQTWRVKPVVALLFGSVARDEAGAESDLDVLLVRPAAVHADEPRWRAQLETLQERATMWTGNEARVLEYGHKEYERLRKREPTLTAAATEGIDLKREPRRAIGKWRAAGSARRGSSSTRR